MVRLNKSYPYEKQLKNRSSKHNIMLTGPGTKPIVRCVSNETLKAWADKGVKGAAKEIERRQKKSEIK